MASLSPTRRCGSGGPRSKRIIGGITRVLFGQVGMAVRPRLWILFFAAWGVVLGQQRPPVILIDGYHLLCQSENLTSAHDFGELEQRLTSDGPTGLLFRHLLVQWQAFH
jgi:hypothetical protein